jgi:TPR repeat protein
MNRVANRNPQKAFHYYKQAAELGSPYAQYCIGTRGEPKQFATAPD